MSFARELNNPFFSTYLSRIARKRKPSTLWLFLIAVFLVCEIAWLVSLAPTDIARYECYGLAFWRGSQGIALLPSTQCSFLLSSTPFPALHALPQEYPPLTVLLFSLPLLTPLPYYALIFALLMTLVALGL